MGIRNNLSFITGIVSFDNLNLICDSITSNKTNQHAWTLIIFKIKRFFSVIVSDTDMEFITKSNKFFLVKKQRP